MVTRQLTPALGLTYWIYGNFLVFIRTSDPMGFFARSYFLPLDR